MFESFLVSNQFHFWLLNFSFQISSVKMEEKKILIQNQLEYLKNT